MGLSKQDALQAHGGGDIKIILVLPGSLQVWNS